MDFFSIECWCDGCVTFNDVQADSAAEGLHAFLQDEAGDRYSNQTGGRIAEIKEIDATATHVVTDQEGNVTRYSVQGS